MLFYFYVNIFKLYKLCFICFYIMYIINIKLFFNLSTFKYIIKALSFLSFKEKKLFNKNITLFTIFTIFLLFLMEITNLEVIFYRNKLKLKIIFILFLSNLLYYY